MAATPTTQIPLGFKAPAFDLPDTISGNHKSYADIKGEKGTVVVFICNHCPFVIHIMEELVAVATEYNAQGFGFVFISSNDVINYPQDGPEMMKEFAAKYDMSCPYLYDESQDVARAYDGACTPDFSVFDNNDLAVYRGQFDGSRPGNNVVVNGEDLREVLDTLKAGDVVSSEGQRPSIGCNIKWKS